MASSPMSNSALAAHSLPMDNYTDITGLNRIKLDSRADKNTALAEVARQFEAVFLQMVLKSMRDANETFAEGNYLNSFETQFHQGMLDNQLSLTLSQKGGLGLAQALTRQLQQRFGDAEQTDGQAAADAADWRRMAAKATPLQYGKQKQPGAQIDAAAQCKVEEVTDFVSPEHFVSELYPHAVEAAQRLGADPHMLLAQAALETGWGSRVIRDQSGDNSRNLFGIKASRDWDGEVAMVDTMEYRDGVAMRERAAFRSYTSFRDSFNDYVEFLQSNPRYQEALQSAEDPQAFAEALQRCGYATDPAYAEKLHRIWSGAMLREAVQPVAAALESVPRG